MREEGRPKKFKMGEVLRSTLLALKIKGVMRQGIWVALESDHGPWSMANKKMRTQFYHNMDLNSANNLIESESLFSHGAPDKIPAWLT